MKKVAFTICAKNYLGLAQLLGNTISKYNDDVIFYIIVADEFVDSEILPHNVIIAKNNLNIPNDLWNDMSFKYDLTEFCTAIKPFCFSYLFKKYTNNVKCLYFDPDIAVFNSLNSIYDKLTNDSIILTPHIVTLQKEYTGTLPEQKYLYSGMFNLGFVGMKSDKISNNIIEWWEERLKFGCFKSQSENYFTDQKWIDFLPILCPVGLHISFDLGNNLAPWNFYEREVIIIDNEYYIVNRLNNSAKEKYKLNFVHFSGYNYNSMISGIHIQNNISSFECPEDVKSILLEYEEALKSSNFIKYSYHKYSYNNFSDGSKLQEFHRRIYRRLSEDFNLKCNPFDINSSFYGNLEKNKLINYKDENFKIHKETDSTGKKENNSVKLSTLYSI